ncbi:MAG: hypothetical protein JO235_08805 [Chroococcidiopsidaceae cyanobacterium CP_BM_RX_35]|nr:hypothetical protein [Chroococcidiopsidaceae cyanobacterium CP_BM_RX_35]
MIQPSNKRNLTVSDRFCIALAYTAALYLVSTATLPHSITSPKVHVLPELTDVFYTTQHQN